MNFLQMCQRVFSEGGISGQINSVENQTGEALRVVQWVAQAYQDIMNDQGIAWNFLRKTATLQLTANKQQYSFSDFSFPTAVQWDTRTFRVATRQDMTDETFMRHMAYSEFRDYWLFSARRSTTSRPLNASVTPETDLIIAPIPDRDYWVNFHYQVVDAELVSNEDTPVWPKRFHMAIVWKALREYGLYESAVEVVARADANYRSAVFQLELDQSPEVVVGDALC